MDARYFGSKLSEILTRYKAVEPTALQEARDKAQTDGVRLEKYLVENKLVPSEVMTLALAEYLHMTPISLAHFVPNAILMESLDREMMKKHVMYPITKVGKCLTIALGDPFDIMAMEELRTATGMEVTPVVASEKEILDLPGKASGIGAGLAPG